ncbi:MAG TPA: four helix bundle protein [Candidatus Binatia bacterium]|nr:four helix bundle protein [Candidatus Binatia bacterium]
MNSNSKIVQGSLRFAVTALVDQLPRMRSTDIYTGQLLRAATSVAANYRAVCRARSSADMVSKLGIVEEEADETSFWLGMLVDARKAGSEVCAPLIREADEIVAMTVASIKTLRRRINPKSKIQNPKSCDSTRDS